jgi:hypothetical protein
MNKRIWSQYINRIMLGHLLMMPKIYQDTGKCAKTLPNENLLENKRYQFSKTNEEIMAKALNVITYLNKIIVLDCFFCYNQVIQKNKAYQDNALNN